MFTNLISIRRKSKLKCPDCNDLMHPYRCGNEVIDKCEICDGIWFDDKEFGVFKRSLDAVDLKPIQEFYHPVETSSYQISQCPRCKVDLEEAKYGYNTKVKIKKCIKCSGMWLPIGESIKLIQLIKTSQENSTHLEGLTKEFQRLHYEAKRYQDLKKTGEQLGQRIPFWRRLYVFRLILLLPLYDENPRSTFPLVTLSLISANIALFFLMYFYKIPVIQIYSAYALQPAEIINGHQLYTLITSIFLHAGIIHLAGNMFFLWTFGDNVESRLGSFKYFIFYLFCGLVAGGAQILSGPSSMTPILGASGAISGVIAAYVVFFPHVNIKTLILGYIVDLPTWLYVGFWVMIQFGSALAHASSGFTGGVAWWAHLGGFLAGMSTALLINNRFFDVSLRKRA